MISTLRSFVPRNQSIGDACVLLDLAAAEENSEAILALDEAFQRLEGMDPRLGQIVRLRFFVGLSVDETAAALEVSRRTVLREWEFARTWLFTEIAVNG
jgi:DNA-directed RNA polymerase specialized sigma24 family protein